MKARASTTRARRQAVITTALDMTVLRVRSGAARLGRMVGHGHLRRKEASVLGLCSWVPLSRAVGHSRIARRDSPHAITFLDPEGAHRDGQPARRAAGRT